MGLRNLAASQSTKGERWDKLYRKIHNKYLVDEFVHIDDYNKMVDDMNARIKALEDMVTQELSKVQQGLASHAHKVSTQGSAAAQVGDAYPPASPPYTSAMTPTQPVVPVTTAMQKADQELLLQGPAQAPLIDSTDPDSAAANASIVQDIGV